MEVLTDCDINVVIYSTNSTRNTSASKSLAQGLSDKKLLKKNWLEQSLYFPETL